MENKSILFIYYKLFKPGGVARVLVSLANNLVEEGHDITILLMMENTKSFYDLDKRVKVIYIDTYSHWGFKKINVNLDKYFPKLPFRNNIKNYIYDFGQWEMLNKWINKNHNEYDLIISCWYKLSSQLSLNKNVRCKTIAWEHANYEVGGKLWKETLRKQYKNLKGVVCINSNSLKYYKEINSNSALVSNLISEPFESFEKSKITNKENTLIYVGRLDRDKNVNEILTILKGINFNGFKFRIIGDGPLKHELELIVNNDDKLKRNVEFLGSRNISEIFDELSKSKIFLFTSISEAFGLVLLEALFTCNALISYDCNYGPSDIVNEKNGFLIPMHDKELFQEKLQYLIDHPSYLAQLSQSSYEDSKKWKKDKIIIQWNQFLDR